MRKETNSLAFGTTGFGFGAGASSGFVVASLKAASAAARGSLGLRFLSSTINLRFLP